MRRVWQPQKQTASSNACVFSASTRAPTAPAEIKAPCVWGSSAELRRTNTPRRTARSRGGFAIMSATMMSALIDSFGSPAAARVEEQSCVWSCHALLRQVMSQNETRRHIAQTQEVSLPQQAQGRLLVLGEGADGVGGGEGRLSTVGTEATGREATGTALAAGSRGGDVVATPTALAFDGAAVGAPFGIGVKAD